MDDIEQSELLAKYRSMLKEALKDELRTRGLKVSGTKQELINKLIQHSREDPIHPQKGK